MLKPLPDCASRLGAFRGSGINLCGMLIAYQVAAAGSRVRLTATAVGVEKKQSNLHVRTGWHASQHQGSQASTNLLPFVVQCGQRTAGDDMTGLYGIGRAKPADTQNQNQACDEFPSPSHLNATNANSSYQSEWILPPLIIGW